MTVIIMHGTMGTPEGNWFPWLKNELEHQGVKALTPQFPTPKEQSLTSWLKVLDTYKDEFDSNLVLVGHSIAPALILQKLQKLDKPIRGIILVSGWLGKIGLADYDKLNKTFFEGFLTGIRLKLTREK